VIDGAIGDERIAGAVVLMARDGEVVYRRAAGLADREARRPMREDSILLFSSVTKPIVSAAALALVEAGSLGLDDRQRLAKVPMSAGTWRWGGVYGHSWWVDLAQRFSVIVFTNTGVEGMSGSFPTDVANAVYGG
jgi:CubicO group peptidase (beta-lactamase class C family)